MYNFTKKFNSEIAGLIIFVTLLASLSPIFAKKAEAVIPVNDWVNIAKEYGLDAIGGMIVNTIIERMSKSVVNWINTGFKGKPAFIENPEAFYTDIGDKVAGQYIFSNPNLNFLCGPIQAKIRLALTNNYIQDNTRWQCTLTDVAGNMDDFMGNFERGGWDKFFELTQKTQNNPIGAYLQAENEMYLEIATRKETQKEELAQGGGFLSYKTCKPGTEATGNEHQQCSDSYNTCLKGGKSSPEECSVALKNCDANIGGLQAGECSDKNTETVTPGSVIEAKLNEQLGMGQGKLQVADELNEIVSALLNQLIQGVVGGIGKGLRGLSQPDSTQTGSPTFTNQLSNSTPASTTDYFGNQQNLEILNTPIPNQNPVCDPNNASYNPLDSLCITP